MTRTGLDTSVIVAALLSWHERHVACRRSVEAVLVERRSDRLLIPVPALVEAYAVMTRLPAPHRLAPGDAHELLSASFDGRARVVGLDASPTWPFLRSTAETGIAGGRTYDALILACLRMANANRLLTLDERDFTALGPEGIEIVVP